MRILVALDDSRSARYATRFLAALKPPEQLVLLHAVDVLRYQPPFMPPRMSKDYHGRLQKSLVASAHDLLDELEDLLPSDFKNVENRVVVGEPVKMILMAVTRYKPDLLMLGSRSLDALQEWFVDSVSYKVASQVSCPVLVVKRPIDKVQKVLLAYDGSDEADRAADFLKQRPFHDSVELTIAMVWPKQVIPPKIKAAAEQLTKRAKIAGAELAKGIKARLPAGRFKTSVESVDGDPGKTLVRLATERQSDLLIVGARRLTRVKSFFLGSVSHTALHRAPCAVLIVKGRQK